MEDMADRLQPVLPLVQLDESSLPAFSLSAFEQACDRPIIGTHVKPVAELGSHGTPGRPNPWIDHDHMDGPFREVWNRAGKNIRGLTNVLGLDHVTQIGNL